MQIDLNPPVVVTQGNNNATIGQAPGFGRPSRKLRTALGSVNMWSRVRVSPTTDRYFLTANAGSDVHHCVVLAPRRLVAFAVGLAFAQLSLGTTPMQGGHEAPRAAMATDHAAMSQGHTARPRAPTDAAMSCVDCALPPADQPPCDQSSTACAAMGTCATAAFEIVLTRLATIAVSGWAMASPAGPPTNPSISGDTPPPRG